MTTTDTYTKLVPTPNQDTHAYWDALREHRLTFQTCGKCGTPRHYPRPVCSVCYSMDVIWKDASGRGKVHSWTVAHHPFHPGFKGEVPYTLVTVDLEEGVRMQAQLKGADGQPFARSAREGGGEIKELNIGLPVEVRFEKVKDDLVLPYFVEARG